MLNWLERVRRVGAIWYVSLVSAILQAHDVFREVPNRSVTVPDRSETQSPTCSVHTIRSMASVSTNSSSNLLFSFYHIPPTMDTIPNISDFQSLAPGPCLSVPSLRSHTVDVDLMMATSWHDLQSNYHQETRGSQ